MALAVSEIFEALCSFKPFEEIKKVLEDVPEFKELIGEDLIHQFNEQKHLKGRRDFQKKKAFF